MTRKLIIVHGPNLNLLGERPSKHYGTDTLARLNQKIRVYAKSKKLSLKIFQSNSEGALIDFIHKNRKWADGLVINPAAYTHTSIAIRDAIEACQLPTVEVHLSNVNSRESFRKKSLIKGVCLKQFSGKKANSYLEGISFLCQR